MLLKPTSIFASYEGYREVRLGLLQAVCHVMKVKFPEATDILGIATEPIGGPNDERSEDAIYFEASEWTEEMQTEALELQQELGILTNATEFRRSYREYPAESGSPAP